MTRALRVLVAVALLAFLLTGVDWVTVLGHLEQMSPGAVAVIMLALAAQLAVSAWKWQWALRIHRLHFHYLFLTRVLVCGFFLNNFLPTSIGGDAYRIYRTIPAEPPKSRAISALLLERIVGLCALLVLGLAGASVLYASSPLARTYVMLAAAGVAGVIGIAALFSLGHARLREARLLRSPKLAAIRENLRSIASARGAWLPLIALSFLFQVQAIFIVQGLFAAVDAPVTLAQAALVAASAGLASVIPLSINGLGVVEASIAGTAVAVGVSYEAGLLVALLIRILVIPHTLLAGLIYALEPVHVRDISTSVSNIRSPG